MLQINSPRFFGFEAYPIVWLTAWLLGLGIFAWLRSKQGKSPKQTLVIGFGVFVSAVLGGRFFYFLNHPDLSWSQTFSSAYGGLVLLGSILGAGIFLKILSLFQKNEKFLDLCDLVAFSLTPAVALGRLGCFIEGCCHGLPTDSSFGVTYTFGEAAYSFPNQALIPTQLIEFFGLYLIFFIILRSQNLLRPTFVLASCYSVFRFFLEFWRGDQIRGAWGPFSPSQAMSLAIMVGVLVAYFFGLWRVKKA